MIAVMATALCAVTAGGDEPIGLRVENLLVFPSHQPVAAVQVQNRSAAACQGVLSLKPPEGWKVQPARQPVNVPPGQTQRLTFAVGQGRAGEENRYPFEATLQASGRTITHKQDTVCATAPYFKPTLGGDAKQWNEAIPVRFAVGGKATAVSTYWNRNQFCLLVAVEEDRLTPLGAAGAACDAVQIAMSAQGTKTGSTPAGESTRYEFLVAADAHGGAKCFQLSQPGMKLEETARYRPLDPLLCPSAQATVRRSGATTYYECALPIKTMREHIRPGEGREFCLSVLVHDPEGTGLRDLGAALGVVERNRLAWSRWPGAKWPAEAPCDNKLEWGMCASKY